MKSLGTISKLINIGMRNKTILYRVAQKNLPVNFFLNISNNYQQTGILFGTYIPKLVHNQAKSLGLNMATFGVDHSLHSLHR